MLEWSVPSEVLGDEGSCCCRLPSDKLCHSGSEQIVVDFLALLHHPAHQLRPPLRPPTRRRPLPSRRFPAGE